VKIDVLSEIQDPRPWDGGHEHRRIVQTLEQAELADELGYASWWQVERHGAEELSLSSAPELLLTAISQRTRRIRLGHSAVLAPYRVNHPIRVAERAALLDHLSEGRLELGLARPSAPECRAFNVDPDQAREQLHQALEMIPTMWTCERFSWKSRHLEIQDVAVVPRPHQRPHPPLWLECTSPASFVEAGHLGVGALGTGLWASRAQVRNMVSLYRRAIRECSRPVGEFVNDQVAFLVLAHCADSDEEAKRAGALHAAAWYARTASAALEAEDRFLQPPDWDALGGQDSIVVGGQETCLRELAAFAELGVDRLLTLHQLGPLPHQAVLRSIRRLGALVPELDGGGGGAPAPPPPVT